MLQAAPRIPYQRALHFSLALRLLCEGYAASPGTRREKIRDHANCYRRSLHSGSVDTGLRHRRLKLRIASATTTAFHRRDGRAEERIGAARKYDGVYRERHERDRYESQLERERHTKWKRDSGNHRGRWRVHRARGPAVSRDGAGFRDEPCGRDEIRHGCVDRYERRHPLDDAEFRER